MNNRIKFAVAAAVALITVCTALVAPAADIVRATSSPIISGGTINSGTVSNYNYVMDTSKGKDLFLQVSFDSSTNFANTAAYGTLTNIVVVLLPGIGDGNYTTNAVPATYTLSIPYNQTGYRWVGQTNITVYGVPAVKLWYITNQCGVDANCKITNLTVSYWNK